MVVFPLAHVELSGIQPNPWIESVEAGIALYRENSCDFVLAVGGGSTLDACKAIAAGVKYAGPVSDLFVNESGLSAIAAARVQDRMNEGIMKAVLEDAPKILADPNDYDARANIMWASSMALAGFQLLLGKPMFAFPLHGMGHELSSLYDMTHGVTLALVTPAWMRHTMSAAPEYLPIFARFGRNVMAVREEDDAEAAEAGVRQLEKFYSAIKMPANLREAGVKEEDLEAIAVKAVENGNLGHPDLNWQE